MEEIVVGSDDLEKEDGVDRLRAVTVSETRSLAIYYNLISGAWEILRGGEMLVSGSLGYVCNEATKMSDDAAYVPDEGDIIVQSDRF